MDSKEFAETIQQGCLQAGMRCAALMMLARRSPSTVSHWKSGRLGVTLDAVIEIEAALERSIASLLVLKQTVRKQREVLECRKAVGSCG